MSHRLAAFAVIALIAGSTGVLAATSGPPTFLSNPTPVITQNPPSAPAITSDVDNPGRVPYQFSHRVTNNQECFDTLCEIIPPAIPAGKEFVAQHVSITGIVVPSTASKPNYMQAILRTGDNEILLSTFFVPLTDPIFANGLRLGAIDLPVHFYLNPGRTYLILIGTDGSFLANPVQMEVVVTGYLVDCAVNQCTAVVPPEPPPPPPGH